MSRPIQALIHQQALANNLEQVRKSAPNQQIFAVVKANAYGHGLVEVFSALKATDGFATLELDSARLLRQLDWRGPILLLEGVFEARELEICSRFGIWHAIHNEQQIEWLAQHKTASGHRVFLKLNMGMNRLGFTQADFRTVWARLNALPQVDEISMMAHFSDADRVDTISNPLSITNQQIAIFEQQTAGLTGERSICNSIASLKQLGQELKFESDWLRAGYALYGGASDYPLNKYDDWKLQPAMTLAAKIIAVQHLQPGQTVGYGSTFIVKQSMRIGVVACGYADGYPRRCSTGTPVLIQGKHSTIVGRVSMDMLVVDLTNHPDAKLGTWVTLWGYDRTLYEQVQSGTRDLSTVPVLSIDEIAQCAGTIGYELCSQITPRVPKVVID